MGKQAIRVASHARTVCCSMLKTADVAVLWSVAGSPAVGTYQYVPVVGWLIDGVGGCG